MDTREEKLHLFVLKRKLVFPDTFRVGQCGQFLVKTRINFLVRILATLHKNALQLTSKQLVDDARFFRYRPPKKII